MFQRALPASTLMIALLRALSFIAGLALLAAPSFLLLQFAYGVGEPPESQASAFFLLLLPVCMGFILGGGLLLAGLPHLVLGPRRPTMRLVAGLLMVTSAGVVVLFGGFSGSVTKIATPAVLLLNALAFLAFVWPARAFTMPMQYR